MGIALYYHKFHWAQRGGPVLSKFTWVKRFNVQGSGLMSPNWLNKKCPFLLDHYILSQWVEETNTGIEL
jgi:hypothetical protein